MTRTGGPTHELRATSVLVVAVTAGGGRLECPLAQFGKNKITYETFDWKVYESPHFNVHYYDAEEIFLEEIVSYAESAYLARSVANWTTS